MVKKIFFRHAVLKAGEKNEGFKGERGQDGVLGGVQSWFCRTRGLGEGCTDILVLGLHCWQQMWTAPAWWSALWGFCLGMRGCEEDGGGKGEAHAFLSGFRTEAGIVSWEMG